MSFTDIFKKSFIEGYSSIDINVYTACISLLLASLMALYIFVVYRTLTRKTFYSKNFNVSLVGITVITTGIILTIQSSIVVSLGMVGALSIVRFRTAVKDPSDLMFLFWAIAVGIICGVGLAEIAVLLCLTLTVLVFVLNFMPVTKPPLILVINSSVLENEKVVMEIVRKYSKVCAVKSRSMTKVGLDLIVELRTSMADELLREILNIDTVESASIMSHDGEVTF